MWRHGCLAETKADQPDAISTTMPPAKSIALIEAAGLASPFINPFTPHTMCARGQYTNSTQSTVNASTAENFMRSTTAPTITAGVMIANIS
jgi:hypothetical protein